MGQLLPSLKNGRLPVGQDEMHGGCWRLVVSTKPWTCVPDFFGKSYVQYQHHNEYAGGTAESWGSRNHHRKQNNLWVCFIACHCSFSLSPNLAFKSWGSFLKIAVRSSGTFPKDLAAAPMACEDTWRDCPTLRYHGSKQCLWGWKHETYGSMIFSVLRTSAEVERLVLT